MAIDVQTFLDLHKEFDGTPQEEIQGALDDALGQLDTELYEGPLLDMATHNLAAHILAVSPFGRTLRTNTDAKSTLYINEYRRIRRIALCGF